MEELAHTLLSFLLSNSPENTNLCALNRCEPDSYKTLETAKELGFSAEQAYGIMDGWRHARRGYSLYVANANSRGYAEGFALGQEAWRLRPEAG